ncbi:MAG: AMP-binding protein [Actinomycetota bacterium]
MTSFAEAPKRLFHSVKTLVDMGHPDSVMKLARAGAFDLRTPIAIAAGLPWLIGRGPSLGVMSRMHAASIGSRTAIVDRDGSFSWKEFDSRSDRAAHLLSSLGVHGGDTIALVLRNGHEMAELLMAAQKMGVSVCPVNTWARQTELRDVFASASPKAVFCDVSAIDDLPDGLINAPLLQVGGTKGRFAVYEAELEAQSPSMLSPFTTTPGSPRVIIHTSGTTGRPKGAARDASAAGIRALSDILGVLPLRRDDRVFCPAPMFHSFGLAMFTFATALGATLLLPEAFKPRSSVAWIESERATVAAFVPVMLRRIVADASSKGCDLSSLRMVISSGSYLSPELRGLVTDVFGEVLYDLYGSTEAGWVTIAGPDDMRTHPDAVGKLVRGVDVAVVSDTGSRLPAGQTGRIFVKSGVALEGYTTGESMQESAGYIGIGDLGYIDEDDYVYIEGRSDDMVVVGGENVYPIEVEQVIESLSGVVEASVIGIQDKEFGQVLAAAIEGDVDIDRLVAHCKASLASYKVPRRFVVAELPRNATGKVVKAQVRGLFT